MNDEDKSLGNLDDLVLLKIFNLLNLKTLYKCRTVSKKWKCLVNEVVSKRNSSLIETFIYLKHMHASAQLIAKSEFRSDLNEQLAKIMAQPALILCLLTKRLQNKFIFDDVLVDKQQQQHDDSIPSANKRARRPQARCVRNSVSTKFNALEVLRDLLPKESLNLYVFSSGVVGTDYSRTNVLEIEALNKREFGISCLSLPDSSKYRVGVSCIVSDRHFNSIENEQDLNDFLCIRQDEQLKFMFLFVKTACKWKLESFFDALNDIRRQNPFGVSGGYIDSIQFRMQTTDYNIVILSYIVKKAYEKSLSVAQIVLPSVDRDNFQATLDAKMSRLKRTGIASSSKRISLGFQVCCIGKGKEFHKRDNLESQIFQKYFPGLPIIGFYGYGEIGLDYLPDLTNNLFHGEQISSTCDETDKKDDDNFSKVKWHFYCTAFTILSVEEYS